MQIWWHGSIDGCAGDIYGLWLGQQHWVLHFNACSTGTLGHMPLPPAAIRQQFKPTIRLWWDAPATFFVQRPCGSERCYCACQTVWAVLTQIAWPGSSLMALPCHPNLWTLQAICISPEQQRWKAAQSAHRCRPCPNKLDQGRGRGRGEQEGKVSESQQFNYPALLVKVFRNRRLDLVDLIPTLR